MALIVVVESEIFVFTSSQNSNKMNSKYSSCVENNELIISAIQTGVLDTIWSALQISLNNPEKAIRKMKVVKINQKSHKCPKCLVRFTHI